MISYTNSIYNSFFSMGIFLLLKLQVRRSEEKELGRRRMVIASTNPHYKEIAIRKRIASMYIFLSHISFLLRLCDTRNTNASYVCQFVFVVGYSAKIFNLE
jgi:hypothetical protein